MPSGAQTDARDLWLSIETIRDVAGRLEDGGVEDPSPSQVAAALGVHADVVLAVLAAQSRARVQCRSVGEPRLVEPDGSEHRRS